MTMCSKNFSFGKLGLLSSPEYRVPARVRRMLCGFVLRGEEWVAEPDVLFRPYALMLWNVPDRAKVSHCVAGAQGQILASRAAVPASFFATGRSFEDVVARFEKEGIEAPYWCDFDVLEPGVSMRLQVRDEHGAPVRSLDGVLLGLSANY